MNTGYADSGFLALQLAIDRAIIAHHHSNNANSNASSTTSVRSNPAHVAADSGASGGEFSLRLQRHPYPPYEKDFFVTVALAEFLSYFIMLTFLFTAPCIVKDVIVEKENKLKVRGGVNKLGRGIVKDVIEEKENKSKVMDMELINIKERLCRTRTIRKRIKQ